MTTRVHGSQTRRRRPGSRATRPAEVHGDGGDAPTLPGRSPAPLRRTGLPSGRAVTGGLLVAVAALLAFAAAGRDDAPAGRPVVVAARDLAPGTVLRPDDLELRSLTLPDALRARVAASTEVLDGAVTLAPLRAGDLIQASSVADGTATPTSYEVAMALPADRVVQDRLRVGDRVDVLATFGTGDDAHTDVVVRRALVQQREESGGGGFATDTVAVTLGLDDAAQELSVTHALRAGEVTLVRATSAADVPEGPVSWPPAPDLDVTG